MTLTRKDATATALTILVVLVFAATHERWGVPLIGDGRRWAAATILLLGALTCGQGTPDKSAGTTFLALLGIFAGMLGVAAIATGSLTLTSLLVATIVALWAISTLRHATHVPRRPIAA